MCERAEVSRASFYRHWEEREPAAAETELRGAIQRLAVAHRYDGYRRIAVLLQREGLVADATLAEVRVPQPKGRPRQKPKRVIADRGFDSDPLRQRWKRRGIELIAPYRRNNKERRYEDGRKLRRYKRRWKIERTNAWLGQFRRLLVRHEHLFTTYRAFFYLACLWITLRKCF